ncbi:MAG: T9SS type A sorting domain-containing protein [Thermotogae bacterium]|nr:T9SS type A sorting domain-containing protein [Thermotogota bacterium]
MKRVFAFLFLPLALPLWAGFRSFSSDVYADFSAVKALTNGSVVGVASASGRLEIFKTEIYGRSGVACSLSVSPSTFARMKVRDDKVAINFYEGMVFLDTTLSGYVPVTSGSRSSAALLGGDTVAIVWGSPVSVSLGVFSTGFVSRLEFPLTVTIPVGYEILSYGGNGLMALIPRSDSGVNMLFMTRSGVTLSHDSSKMLDLPHALATPSAIVAEPLGSGFVIGLTVEIGSDPHPVVIFYDGSSVQAYAMDQTGVLNDLRVTPEGILVTAHGDSSYVQLLPYTMVGDSSLKGLYSSETFVGGADSYAFGYYVLSGTYSDTLNLFYTDMEFVWDTLFDFFSFRSNWTNYSATLNTLSVISSSSSPALSGTPMPCISSLISFFPLGTFDTLAPYLVAHPMDDTISAVDTLVYTFSEAIDPLTFQNGVEVEVFGFSSKFPAVYGSFCSGTMCYLTLNIPGADSVRISLTAAITDTAGVPLSSSSRRSDVFYILPSRPYVVFTQPDSGEINVPLNANVGVWFSGPIDTTTVNGYSVTINDGSSSYPFSVSCPFTNMCVLDPLNDFPPGAHITVSFTSAITDTLSQPLYPKVITFTTIPEDTLSPRVARTIPDSGDINVPRNFAMSILFSKDMDTTTVASGISLLGSSSGSHTFTVSCPTRRNCIVRPLTAFLPMEMVTVRFNSSILDTTGRSLIPKTVVFQVGTSYDNTPPNVQILAPSSDTLELYHPILSPIKAAVWDNTGILMASWSLDDEGFHAPLSCRGLPYVASDTTCLDVSEVPSGIYDLKVIAYDLANSQGIDSVVLVVHDTVRPRVSYSEPAPGEMAVSPYTDVRITFNEPMDTTVFPPSAVVVLVGGSSVSYSHSWLTSYTLRLTFSNPLPWDSTVNVSLSSLQDLSGNLLIPYSFNFTVVGENSVYVTWIKLDPDTVFYDAEDSVEVVVVATSDYSIRKAYLMIGNADSVPMLAADGSFDEPVETLKVWLKTKGLQAGIHNLGVKAFNPYVFGVSESRSLTVLDAPKLSKENVFVYPNPVKERGKIKVVVGEPTTLAVEVFDLKYRRVFHEVKSFQEPTVYESVLPPLPVGVYLLRVKADNLTVLKWFSVVGRR